jgi:phosphohistidine phosphatase SixA
LSAEGREEVRRLREFADTLQIRPDVILSSHYTHAKETGTLLFPSPPSKKRPAIITLDALTPKSPTESFEEILAEKQVGQELKDGITVAIAGHEPRLSQLVMRLTGTRGRPLIRAEMVCLEAPSLRDFVMGNGRVIFRYPVADHQETALREKIASKVSVSTLLAGFTSTALFLLLTPGGRLLPFQTVGALFLTAALVLFIAAVYMYDRLSMPVGFWAGMDRRGRFNVRRQSFEQDRRQNGDLYAHMVWTWNWVFTPAVFLGLVGFLALLAALDNRVLLTGTIVIVIVGSAYYWLARPRLGTD